MPIDLSGFDADTIEITNDFDPIPTGWYECVMTASEKKETKAGTGWFLELTLEIIGDKYNGRRVWDRLNLSNPNDTAVAIAQKSLKQICDAVGIRKPQDSSEFHDKPLMVKVAIENNEQYGPSNTVKGYKGIKTGQAAASATTNAATPTASTTPPWRR